MSTIKSSAENLTLNADGANNDIKFQSNGSEVASIDQAGSLVLSGNLTSLGIDDNADATAITIDASENVGIGTTVPSKTLDVRAANNNNTAQLRLTDASNETSTYLGQFSNGTRLTNNATYSDGWAADDAAVGVTQLELADNYISLGVSAAGSTSPTERIRVTTDGLTFNGDTAAANALDDYEEGTWTPNVGGNASYTVQNGTYVKVGKMCTASCEMHINAIGNAGSYGTTHAVRGLPFNSIASPTHASSAAVGYCSGLAFSIIAITFRVDNNSNIANSATMTSAGTTFATGENLWTNGSRVLFSLTYITA